MNNQLICWFNIGNTHNDNSVMKIGRFGPKNRGYPNAKEWCEKVALPTLNWAYSGGFVPRICLHNPYGKLGESEMHADAYLISVEKKLDWLISGYEALKPVLKAGGEVIFYMGNPQYMANPKNQNLHIAMKPNDYIDFIQECYKPIIDMGYNIGFDASVRGPLHRTRGFVTLYASLLPKVYVESSPTYDMKHYWDYNIMIRETTYQQKHGAKPHPANISRYPKYDPNTKLIRDPGHPNEYYKGEIVRHVMFRDMNQSVPNMISRCHQILNDGHACMLQIDQIIGSHHAKVLLPNSVVSPMDVSFSSHSVDDDRPEKEDNNHDDDNDDDSSTRIKRRKNLWPKTDVD